MIYVAIPLYFVLTILFLRTLGTVYYVFAPQRFRRGRRWRLLVCFINVHQFKEDCPFGCCLCCSNCGKKSYVTPTDPRGYD